MTMQAFKISALTFSLFVICHYISNELDTSCKQLHKQYSFKHEDVNSVPDQLQARTQGLQLCL